MAKQLEQDLIDITPEEFIVTLPESIENDVELLLEMAELEAEPDEVHIPVRARKPKNYINNADLLIQLALSKEQDQMTDHLVHMLQTLCDRYGAKSNFAGYSYIDDMKAYAMYMLVRTWRAFKPEKSSNPFAFFTQCTKHSFIQYLNKERNQRDIRDQLLVENGLNPSYAYGDGDSDNAGDSDY